MDRIKFILRLAGILFLPVVILLSSAVIWENNKVIVDKFYLLGSWWKLRGLRLSDLLLSFLLLGCLLLLSFLLLLYSERKLRRELSELRQIKRQHGEKSAKAAGPSAAKDSGAHGRAKASPEPPKDRFKGPSGAQ